MTTRTQKSRNGDATPTRAWAGRVAVFLMGVITSAIGINLITRAGLGTSPISAVPYVASLVANASFGTFTFVFNIAMTLAQLAIMRRSFPRSYWLQIPIALLFSWLIDLTSAPIAALVPDAYPLRFVMLVFGCLVLGSGIRLELAADVLLLAGDGIVLAISDALHADFGRTKVGFDGTCTVVALVMGLVATGQVVGIREGTVVAALLVGTFARTLSRLTPKMKDRLAGRSATPAAVAGVTATGTSGSHAVITVSREFGSEGRDVAARLAERLGYQLVDEDIVLEAARESGLDVGQVERDEERLPSAIAFDLVAQAYNFAPAGCVTDQLYAIESHVARTAASGSDCVIVGRNADFVCRDFANLYTVFVTGDAEAEAKVVSAREDIDLADARKRVHDVNLGRARHCRYYTGRVWGHADNYDLCVNAGRVGLDQAVDLIVAGAQAKAEITANSDH